MNIIAPLRDLRQRSDRIRHDGRIRVGEHIPQAIDEAFLLYDLLVVGVEFRNADGGRFSNVGIFVLEAVSERFDESMEDGGDGDVGHGANGEGSDECVLVVCILMSILTLAMYFDAKGGKLRD